MSAVEGNLGLRIRIRIRIRAMMMMSCDGSFHLRLWHDAYVGIMSSSLFDVHTL
jgi:hypothetical protein